MGNTQDVFIDFEDETNGMTLKYWENDKYINSYLNSQSENRGTINISSAIPIIKNILSDFNKRVKILEVGSGNGYNTNMIKNKLSNHIDYLKATDMKVFDKNYYDIEQMLSHEAVNKYGKYIDILLLVSPPPIGFMDYYAIKSYQNIDSRKKKHIIYLGEMGSADGATGMYPYMLENKYWKLKDRKEFKRRELFENDICIKEVFYFTN